MRIIICLFTIFSVFLTSTSSYASEATPAMLDEKGCHVCKRACSKFGLQDGKYHCHAIKPNEYKLPAKLISIGLPNRSVFLLEEYVNLLNYAKSYVAIDPDVNNLIIVPSKRDPSGTYKTREKVRKLPGLEKGDCHYGDPLIIKGGAPQGKQTAFGANFQPDLEGIYTVTIRGRDYLSLAIQFDIILVLDENSNIFCVGNIKKDRVEMFCQSLKPTPNIDRSTPCCLADYVRM